MSSKWTRQVLRELAADKNLDFRQGFLGRNLSVVTLRGGRSAVSENYLKVELATPRPANQLIDVAIDALTGDGLREKLLFPLF